MDPTLKLLCDLIAIDSVNPDLVPGAAGERAISEFLAHELKKLGADVELTEIASGLGMSSACSPADSKAARGCSAVTATRLASKEWKHRSRRS
jgi:hypothetical protein